MTSWHYHVFWDQPWPQTAIAAPGRRRTMCRRAVWVVLVCLIAFCPSSRAPAATATGDVTADPLDWPYWRGPEYNGISRETGLIDDWDPEGGDGSNVAWVRDDLGGRGTPIVMQGRLYTIIRALPGTAQEGERVVCVDAVTGETIWENRFNVALSDVPAERVGWSSCVGDPSTGNIYALGVNGLFQCLDGKTGKTIWSKSLHERFGLLSTYGGRTNFPVIFEDLVIVSAVIIGWGDMARPTHRFLAMDKNNGDVVWIQGTQPLPYDTTYSAPSLTVLDGQAALVFGSGDGAVWALQPRTGQPIWNFRLSRRGLNTAPLVVGDTIYMSHSEENIIGTRMGTVVAIDGAGSGDITDSGELWRVDEMMAGKSSPIAVDDRLFVFDDRAKLRVLNAKTGAAVGRRIALGRMMRASPLYADGKIYALTANGRWQIIKPDARRGATTVAKGELPSGDGVHASPVCSHGRIYIQSTGRLYCLMDPNKQPGATPRPAVPQEIASSQDTTPAHLQVVPSELLMRPGATSEFTVRLYNARGQRLASSDATFTVDGPGTIAPDGTFTAPSGSGHVATTVKANVGSLTGIARVRVVPPLPWMFDFETTPLAGATGEGLPPVTWVGARYRHVIREMDGSKVMVKITTIPKGTRSRCWFGHSDLANYTIQADVRGASQDDKMPDVGLIAQGYVLDLQGASQKLQIRSWSPQLRMARTIDFKWSPDTWYTMKLKAAAVSGRAVLQAKVWPRGQSEPDAWTIEATDESPNLAGSPGLFGNAKDAEIYLDNISVTENESSPEGGQAVKVSARISK